MVAEHGCPGGYRWDCSPPHWNGLQPSILRQRPHLFFSDASVCRGAWKGKTDVPVQANVALKAGDVLFQIDPRPFQYVVEEKKALLAEAEQNVGQLKASFDAATAAVNRADAQYHLAKENYDRQTQLFEKKSGRAGHAGHLLAQS